MNSVCEPMDIDNFIQTIIEEPNIDDHRLIFADFLEEHNDPRAELIRLQFAMREIPKSTSKWTTLRSQELKLLRKHGGFGKPPKIGKILSWHGGFVDEIETTLAQFATRNEELLAKTTVRGLQLRASSKQFKKVLDSQHLHRLRKLTFKSNRIPNHELCEFLALDTLRLKELSIQDGHLTNDVGRTIGRMKHFESLESLELTGATESIAAIAIANSPHLSNLTSLTLRYQLDDEGVEKICSAKTFQNLRRLELSGEFTNQTIAWLHNATFRSTLEELVFRSGSEYDYHYSSTRDGDYGLTKGFENPLPNLKSLEIGSGMPDGMLIEIAKNYRGLESLDCGYNVIGDQGIAALAQSELLSTLKRLVLTGNQVTPASVEMLCNSEFWTGKTKLYLRSNDISQAQIKELKEKYGKTFGNFGPDWQRI